MPGGDDDFGFVPDDGADDFGFEPEELHHETGARTLVLPETTISPGAPATVAPGPAVEERDVAPAVDALPDGFRTTGRRMTVLPETTFAASVDRRGRVQSGPTTVAPGGGYVAMEAVPDPDFRPPAPPAPPPPPSTFERLTGWALGRPLEAQDAGRFVLGGAPAVAAQIGLPGAPDAASAEAAARGMTDGALFGFGDEARAGRRAGGLTTQQTELASPTFGGAALARALASRLVGSDPIYERALAEEREAEHASREGSPWAYGAGQALGSAPAAMLPGGAATLPGRMGVAGAQGLGLGVLRGAGESEAEDLFGALDQPSVARDALAEGALEGLLSAGGTGAGEGVVAPLLGRLGRWAARRGDDAAESAVQSRLEATGVWGGRAMRAADEMPGGQEALAGDLRRLGIGGGLGQPGRTGPASRFPRPERSLADAAEVMDDAGQRMQAVLDRMDEASSGRQAALLDGTREQAMRGMVDLSRVAGEMEAIAREYERIPVGGPQVANALRSQVIEPLSAQGAVSFSDAWRQRRVLDDMIRSWSRDPNLSTAAGRLQTARRAISRAMDEAAEALDPALREQWRQANRDYSVAAFLGEYGRGAERLSVQGGMGGAFGTAIENAGGGAIAPIVGAPIQREAAQQVRMRWPGLRAVALESLAPRLRALGARGQRWAQALEGAQQRGNTALAATHLMLTQTDPSYRQTIEEIEAAEAEE